MPVDLPALFGNPRMVPAAITPPLATLGVSFTKTPVFWPASFIPAVVVAGILARKLARQRTLKNPAKVWRGLPGESFAFDVLAILAAAFGLLYATQPWVEAFDVRSVLGMSAGFAIAGSALCIVMAPVWNALGRRGEGPMKKAARLDALGVFTVMNVLMLGPFAAYAATLPLQMLYLEEVVSSNPSFMTREGWVIVLTLLMMTPLVLWAYVDLRKRWAKEARSRGD